MFSDVLEDKCSPFTIMLTFELICDTSPSSAMPQEVKNYLFDASCSFNLHGYEDKLY